MLNKTYIVKNLCSCYFFTKLDCVLAMFFTTTYAQYSLCKVSQYKVQDVSNDQGSVTLFYGVWSQQCFYSLIVKSYSKRMSVSPISTLCWSRSWTMQSVCPARTCFPLPSEKISNSCSAFQLTVITKPEQKLLTMIILSLECYSHLVYIKQTSLASCKIIYFYLETRHNK